MAISFRTQSKPYFRSRFERIDTPSAAFIRIVHYICDLPRDDRIEVTLNSEVQYFWHRGITGSSKPDHFLFGGNWSIADLLDPREKLGSDPLLCAIAASAAEQMAEMYNWRIELGLRRDLRMMRVRRPHWDKNLAKPELEQPHPGVQPLDQHQNRHLLIVRRMKTRIQPAVCSSPKLLTFLPVSRSVIFSLVQSSCTLHDYMYFSAKPSQKINYPHISLW